MVGLRLHWIFSSVSRSIDTTPADTRTSTSSPVAPLVRLTPFLFSRPTTIVVRSFSTFDNPHCMCHIIFRTRLHMSFSEYRCVRSNTMHVRGRYMRRRLCTIVNKSIVATFAFKYIYIYRRVLCAVYVLPMRNIPCRSRRLGVAEVRVLYDARVVS